MKNHTNVLWVGLAASDSVYSDLIHKGYFHFAAHSAQKNFIEGIAECIDIKIDEISGFMMPTLPNAKEIITKSYQWKTINGGMGLSVRNINIRYVDALVRTHQMKKACRDWAKSHKNENNVIFVYSAINAYLQGALEVKKICRNTKIYLIITDLPQFMELRPSKLKKMLKDLNWKSLNRAIHSCNGWIPFTKYMIPYLELPEEKCLVIEGSVNCKNIKEVQSVHVEDKIIIMYSGSLGLQYGIPELLIAFSEIQDDRYELWFTGKGNAECLIADYSKKDSRIKNFGFLSSYDELVNLQNQASMLISMRMPTEEASAYCFPSKLFDYMLTGRPVLSFRIGGIPDEYYSYLVLMDSIKPDDIRKTIISVGNMSDEERNNIGYKARQFVIDNKNNVKQSRQICEFVGLINNIESVD